MHCLGFDSQPKAARYATHSAPLPLPCGSCPLGRDAAFFFDPGAGSWADADTSVHVFSGGRACKAAMIVRNSAIWAARSVRVATSRRNSATALSAVA